MMIHVQQQSRMWNAECDSEARARGTCDKNTGARRADVSLDSCGWALWPQLQLGLVLLLSVLA